MTNDMADSRDEPGQSPWEGATFTVSGHDRQEALAAGMDAVLQYVVPRDTLLASSPDSRAAAIRGEGPDLATLFADLVTHLLEHVEEAGGEAFGVRLDGLLRKDQSGFVAWGYLDLPAAPGPSVKLPRLNGAPDVNEAHGQPISIRFAFRH